MKRLAPALVLLLTAPAQADHGVTVQLLLGFGAEADVDSVETRSNGVSQSADGSDEDLEGNVGIQAMWDMALQRDLRAGGRLAYVVAEGDDTNTDYSTYDLGGFGRYFFTVGEHRPYLAAAAGLTRIHADADSGSIDEFSGWGIHVVLGGGVEIALSNEIDLALSLYYSYQRGSPEGETGSGLGHFEVELEDSVATRWYLAVGAAF